MARTRNRHDDSRSKKRLKRHNNTIKKEITISKEVVFLVLEKRNHTLTKIIHHPSSSFMNLYWILWTCVILFILGTAFGSFGWVLIERLADDRSRKNIKSILTGRSICPSCPHYRELMRYELIPIVSWIKQWGTCTQCKSPIPQRYLRVEIASGIVFVITFLRTTYYWLSTVALIWRLVINWLLLLILVYDLQTQYLHTAIRYLLIATIVGFLVTHINTTYSLQLIVYSLLIRGWLMGLIWRGASLYARQRYRQSEGIGSGDVIIIATLAPLLPSLVQYLLLTTHHSLLFVITQLLFRTLIIGSIISLLLAFILNKKRAGQTLAFLPWLIIARRIVGRITPYII